MAIQARGKIFDELTVKYDYQKSATEKVVANGNEEAMWGRIASGGYLRYLCSCQTS